MLLSRFYCNLHKARYFRVYPLLIYSAFVAWSSYAQGDRKLNVQSSLRLQDVSGDSSSSIWPSAGSACLLTFKFMPMEIPVVLLTRRLVRTVGNMHTYLLVMLPTIRVFQIMHLLANKDKDEESVWSCTIIRPILRFVSSTPLREHANLSKLLVNDRWAILFLWS